MTSARIALIAAVAATTGWTVKSIAIGLAGGNDLSSLEGPFFLVGLAFCLLASAALGVALTVGRPPWQRVAAGALGPVAGLVVAGLVDAAVGAVRGPSAGRHWVLVELNLWIVAALLLALAWRVSRRSPIPA